MKIDLRTLPFVLALVTFVLGGVAQTSVNKVVIANGGQFGNPQEDVNLVFYDPYISTYQTVDTLHTQSIQDLLIDSNHAYLAAQDSIALYNLDNGARLATVKFTTPGAESVVDLALSDSFLLAGNWFGPFGGTLTGFNLRVFDRHTLAFVDSVAIPDPITDMVVVGDSVWIARNFSDVNGNDSAGYLSVVDLTTLTYTGDITFTNNDEDLGRLLTDGQTIYGVNSGSNTITEYHPATNQDTTYAVPANITLRSYGPQAQLDEDRLIFRFGSTYGFGQVGLDTIGVFNLSTYQMVDTLAVDSNIIAIAYDTINDILYATQSDFVTFTAGAIFEQGSYTGPLSVGFSPEAIAIQYRFGNAPPYAVDDNYTTNQIVTVFDVQANDFDIDGDDLTTDVVSSIIAFGNAAILNGDSLEFTAFIGVTAIQEIDYEVCDNGVPSLCDTATITIQIDSPQSVGELEDFGFKTFPNPTNSFVRVMGDYHGATLIELRDQHGRVVLGENQVFSSEGYVDLDLTHLPAGVYILSISQEEKVVSHKVLKY